jgi:hypothetical protein
MSRAGPRREDQAGWSELVFGDLLPHAEHAPSDRIAGRDASSSTAKDGGWLHARDRRALWLFDPQNRMWPVGAAARGAPSVELPGSKGRM